jgi:hypothetical protein
MYQPAMRPDQVRSLYYLKLHQRRPMTLLLREAVDEYLQRQRQQHGEGVTEEDIAQRMKRRSHF